MDFNFYKTRFLTNTNNVYIIKHNILYTKRIRIVNKGYLVRKYLL